MKVDVNILLCGAMPKHVCNGSSLFLFLCVQISECFFSLSFHPVDFKHWNNNSQVLGIIAMAFF